MNTQKVLPVSLSERADILDVLRGFALLGVLLDNIFGFTGWGFMTQTQQLTYWKKSQLRKQHSS